MAYLTKADLDGLIPPQFLLEALDDDQDGQEDAGLWDKIAQQASRIGQGLEPLTPGADRAEDSVSVISEDAKTYPHGRLIV